jgi:DNA helicase-2/ATP-dependent DNA helicase PcrA
MKDLVDCVPSPFLAEIPPGLVSYHEGNKRIENPAETEDYFALIKSQFSM